MSESVSLSFTCRINEIESTMSRIKPTFHSVIECMMCASVIGVKLLNYCICKLVHMLCFSWFQMCRNVLCGSSNLPQSVVLHENLERVRFSKDK